MSTFLLFKKLHGHKSHRVHVKLFIFHEFTLEEKLYDLASSEEPGPVFRAGVPTTATSVYIVAQLFYDTFVYFCNDTHGADSCR